MAFLGLAPEKMTESLKDSCIFTADINDIDLFPFGFGILNCVPSAARLLAIPNGKHQVGVVYHIWLRLFPIRFSSGISSLIPSVFTICFSSTQERIYSCWFFPLSEIFSCSCWYSSSLTRNDSCFGLVLFIPLPLHIHDIK